MSSTAARPRRYADLIHELDERRRDPVIPGSWVVVAAEEDLAGGFGISLAKAVEGPSYTHVDGHCVQAVWRLHDGREIPQLRLTAVEISELLESATDALRWLRNGVHPDRILPEMLRAHRAAALARRTLDAALEATRINSMSGRPTTPGDPQGYTDSSSMTLNADDVAALRAMIAVSGAIADLEVAWREMLRSRLPNLARSLWLAGALEISRRAGGDLTGGISGISQDGSWAPNTDGRPHPLVAGLAPTDVAAIGWSAPPEPNPLVDVMRAVGMDAKQASEMAADQIRRAARRP